ncbi:MAG: hypothetical protein FWD56_05490 [Bacteroidales bacterium]|nr:hypothetical protein [Bacteroidales bacterium]
MKRVFCFISVVCVLLFSCSKDNKKTDTHQQEPPFKVSNWNGLPFSESINLVGLPHGSYASFDRPGGFPSSTYGFSEYTWEITGEIKNGIMIIDFPDNGFKLTSDYESFTEGLTMSQIFIQQKDNRNLVVGLHKKGEKFDSRVYILYVGDDFSNDLVTFKSGWNFVETFYNPNWFYGSDEPFWLIGIITQDIHTVFKNGYRWQIEFWL